jgi:hypothetical protein
MQSVVAIFSSLLPAGNALPSSYKSLKSIVSRMGGLTWERYPICHSCELFVFDKNDQRTQCPRLQCKVDRNLDKEKELIYFPLEPQLYRLLDDEALRVHLTKEALQPDSTDATMRTIKDSPFWKKWVLDSGFADVEHMLYVVLATAGDGAPPWKSRGRFKYSVYFMSSEILSFTFDVMSNPRNRLCLYYIICFLPHNAIQLLLQYIYVYICIYYIYLLYMYLLTRLENSKAVINAKTLTPSYT